MSGLILLLLIVGVIYIAMTYFKGTRNSDYNDGFTTHYIDGPDKMEGRSDGFQPGEQDEEGNGFADEDDNGIEDQNNADGNPGDGNPEDGNAPTGDTPGVQEWAWGSEDITGGKAEQGKEPEAQPEDVAERISDKSATADAYKGSISDAYHLSDSGVQIDTEVHLDAKMPSGPDSVSSSEKKEK